jgi:cytochrome c-type biogenesis protein CcmH
MSNQLWLFGGIASLFVLVAFAFVLPPLLRRKPAAGHVDRAAVNVAIYHDQLAELKADLAAGELDAGQYEAARHEIEKRLAEDVPAAAEQPALGAAGSRWVGYALVATLPLAALALYLALGNPAAVDARHTTEQGGPDMDGMLSGLEEKLKQNPGNADGWIMLGRSYAALERYPEAVRAYAQAAALQPGNARLLGDYAEALALSRGGNLQGKPLELVEEALKLDPKNEKGLELAGISAYQREDYAQAAAYWRRLLKVMPGDTPYAKEIAATAAEAERKAAAAKK